MYGRYSNLSITSERRRHGNGEARADGRPGGRAVKQRRGWAKRGRRGREVIRKHRVCQLNCLNRNDNPLLLIKGVGSMARLGCDKDTHPI